MVVGRAEDEALDPEPVVGVGGAVAILVGGTIVVALSVPVGRML